ncbi:MAG: hypothetical protein CVV18_03625 [Gammaproteobacteria bacterium HGW-Gammaproteobacteria-8]|nr:MAG: hypothetical protein CVV18_03625 [Gammaproteobacteria bacterium HGW-Gammaproteobacteria-8]
MMNSSKTELKPRVESVKLDPTGAATIPHYISGHYHWAYLWPPGVWFFDHLPIINCIVFGQYRNMVESTLAHITGDAQTGETVLIASAYGNLVTRLAKRLGDNPLTVIDVAPVQLQLADRKLTQVGLRDKVELLHMDAEALEFEDDSFDTGVMFLLLNEMPPEARERALKHALRVIRPGGQLIVTEYGELGREHFLHRFAPMRWLVMRAEPWLDSLWRRDLGALVSDCAREVGKKIESTDKTLIFSGFYRVKRFRITR